jgi:hypothetical protein
LPLFQPHEIGHDPVWLRPTVVFPVFSEVFGGRKGKQ